MRIRPALLLPALIATALPAQAPAQAMDAYLLRYFKADAPGAAVLVMKDGQVLLRKGYGLANVELGAPVKPDTVFHVASVGKQFTAAAILRLAEQGKLDLQAPIGRYLPEAPRAWEAVTVERLLTHSSGIENLWSDPAFRPHEREDLSPQQILAFVKDKPLQSEPGTQHAYATVNYTILAILVERISGKPYASFLADAFFKPLGMKHTSFDGDPRLVPGLASAYGPGPAPAPFMSKALGFGGGSFYSTTEDLALWTEALHGGRVLSAASLKAMTTAFRLKDGSDTHYGYGLRVHTFDGEPYFQSNGDIPGFHSEVVAMPKSHVFVAILHNGEDLPIGLDPIAKRLAAMAAGRPVQEPKALALSESALKALCGQYRGGGSVRTIGLDKGRLFSQFPGDAPAPISPLSPTECFFDEDPDARLGFTLKDGQAVQVQRYNVDRAPGPIYTRIESAPKP